MPELDAAARCSSKTSLRRPPKSIVASSTGFDARGRGEVCYLDQQRPRDESTSFRGSCMGHPMVPIWCSPSGGSKQGRRETTQTARYLPWFFGPINRPILAVVWATPTDTATDTKRHRATRADLIDFIRLLIRYLSIFSDIFGGARRNHRQPDRHRPIPSDFFDICQHLQ